VAVQSPETTQGRDARSTVAEMESQKTAGSTGVKSYVACLMLALFGPDGSNWRCPFMRAKRTSQLRTQTSEFDPNRTSKLRTDGFCRTRSV
jgi:beta-galactosidase GanA